MCLFILPFKLRIMSRELSEVRREKTLSPIKEHERCVAARLRITLDNSIARNRGRAPPAMGNASQISSKISRTRP